MYQPLRIHRDTPPTVRRLIQYLDRLLEDAHAMMRLPLKEEGLTSPCNFAAAVFLLEIIGGISSTLFQHSGGPGQRYKQLLECYYPWDAQDPTDPALAALLQSREPPIPAPEAAQELYTFWRNPLAHELGMSGKPGGIGKSSPPEDLLEQLELSPSPPLSRTLQRIKNPGEQDALHLSVDALYWGTRIMIYRLTKDSPMMKTAEAYLVKKLKR